MANRNSDSCGTAGTERVLLCGLGLIVAAAWGAIACAAPLPLVDVTLGDQRFPAAQALSGSRSTPAHCRTVPLGLWVEPEGVAGQCIRTYVAGLKGSSAPQATIFFTGDAVSGFSAHDGHQALPLLEEPGDYAHASPSSIQQDLDRAARVIGTPLFFVSRPGIYGSSGEALTRTTPAEMMLMQGAVDRLKTAYGIRRFHLYGQSGGGTIVAALINLRDDVGCAAMASGLLDVRQWLAEQRSQTRGGNFDWYDPIAQFTPNTLKPRILVLSDPRDRKISFTSQTSYVQALAAAGGQVTQIVVSARGRFFHETTWPAFQALRLCLANIPSGKIKERLEDKALSQRAAKPLPQRSG